MIILQTILVEVIGTKIQKLQKSLEQKKNMTAVLRADLEKERSE